MSTDDIALFDFDGQRVRVVVRDSEPWFVASDVARVLGYSDPQDAVARHVDREDTTHERINTASELHDPVIRRIIAVNESGLYSLIFGSKLPAAKAFKRWVTAEVLPTIRKTGGWLDPKIDLARALVTDPDAALDFIDNITSTARELRASNRALAAANQQLADEHVVLAPKAAAYDAWFDTSALCSVRDTARLLYGQFGLRESELRERLRTWRWVEKNTAAATAYAVACGYMVNQPYVTEFGPRPSSGRITPAGFQRIQRKLDAEHALSNTGAATTR